MDRRYTLPDPDLAYDYPALEPHYSARMLDLSHDKHHAGYVTGANTTLAARDFTVRSRPVGGATTFGNVLAVGSSHG